METTSTGRVITAFFDDRSSAERTVEKLVSRGVPRDQIRFLPGYEASTATRQSHQHTGFWDALGDFFLPDEDRYTYAEGLSRGGYLISVTASDQLYQTVLEILDDEGTIDMDEREATWRREGWQGYQTTASNLSSRTTAAGRETTTRSGEETVIPVAEEQLRVGKRDTSLGRVRVRSYVVEQPVSEDVRLREENVTVERRPVDRPLTAEDRIFQDRSVEMEQHREEAVVSRSRRRPASRRKLSSKSRSANGSST
jgi:hypothetical protein